MLVLLIFVESVALAAWPGNAVYWLSEGRIASYLKKQTPIGTTRTNVIAWLKAHDAHAKPLFADVHVSANSDFPQTKVGGASFVADR